MASTSYIPQNPSIAQLLLQTAKEQSALLAQFQDEHADMVISDISPSDPHLSTLLSHPLPTLLSLPTTLKSSLSSLSTSLSTLSHKSYPVFLKAHQATRNLDNGLQNLGERAVDMRNSTVVELRTGVRRFVGIGDKGKEREVDDDGMDMSAILEEREKLLNLNSTLLPKVLDLVSIPSHVSNCIRTNQWTEALELFDLLKGLLDSYISTGQGSAYRLLSNLCDQTKLEILGLRSLVVSTLRERGLKLPAAVRCINLLRRMENLDDFSSEFTDAHTTEKELRVIFLLSRLSCLADQIHPLNSQLAGLGVLVANGTETAVEVENEERVKIVKKWVEVWREVVGEASGMFLGIFLSDTQPTPVDSDDSFSLPPLPHPLPHFLSHALTLLQTHLDTNLPHLSSASTLSSLLTQLSYCSDSFSRYGFGFKSIIAPSIISRLEQVLTARLREGGRVFKDTLRLRREEGIRRQAWRRHSRLGSKVYNYESFDLSSSKSKNVLDWLIAPDSMVKLLSLSATQLPSTPTSFTHLPPPLLSLFPPLAKLVNSQASTLNELRLLPALSLRSKVEKIQKIVLTEAAEEIVKFWNTDISSIQTESVIGKDEDEDEELDEEEKRRKVEENVTKRRVLNIFILLFSRTVVPWCLSALHHGIFNEPLSNGTEGHWNCTDVVAACEEILSKEKNMSNGHVSTNGIGKGIVEEDEDMERKSKNG